MTDPYRDWCQKHGVTHGHCPLECPKPQPVEIYGVLCCGRCASEGPCDGVFSMMIPCTVEMCGEEG